MKTKKKENPTSRFFTRGEKVTGRRHHGRKSSERKDEIHGQTRKPEEAIPTA
jgi:hypothetical protein